MTDTPFKGEKNLESWLDRHHVDTVRTQVTTLDGASLGKYCNRNKFLKTLPEGHGISDLALAMDLAGTPHMTFWHPFRRHALGDIAVKPDLDTLISDGTDPNLGHVICDFTQVDGTPINLCPRTLLKNIVAEIFDLGYTVKATCELEFFLFQNSFEEASRKKYQGLTPVGASKLQNIYYLRNAYHAKTFMDEVTKRLDWYGISWEGWNDEAGVGQIELNLSPADPLRIADDVMRVKNVLYEVAVDLDMSVTFMAHPMPGYSSGMHVHHSLLQNGKPAFYDSTQPDNRSQLLRNWIGGIIKTMPGAVSYLCPTINSYRRLKEFSAPPLTATWGEENKSTALRLVSRTPKSTRIEHRLGAADLNPYLGIAVILAGGLAGVNNKIEPPDEFKFIGWGLPDSIKRLPLTITRAAEALRQDELLREVLGADVVDYWLKTRQLEWFAFHTEGGDPDSDKPCSWEYQRYFAIV